MDNAPQKSVEKTLPEAVAEVDADADAVAVAAFLQQAENLLSRSGFTTDSGDMQPWLTDWRGRYSGEALALAQPATLAEVSALVTLCAKYAISIVPQGGNTGMSGGATPLPSAPASRDQASDIPPSPIQTSRSQSSSDPTSGAPASNAGSILLSLRRMNTIRSLNPATCSAICEAGVILQHLHEAAEAEEMRFPLTLGGKGSATIGGLVSTNAGGTQVLRHGTMRAQILGLEAVMADGSVFDALVELKKDNRGFDLKQLLIGSEGTLGIITAAHLRLVPTIQERRVLWAGLKNPSDARKLLLLAQPIVGTALEGFEIIPQECLSAVLDHLPNARAPLQGEHAWHVLIELVAPASAPTQFSAKAPAQSPSKTAEDQLNSLSEELLSRALEGGIIDDATIAANETQAEQLWLLRDSISAAERAIGPAMQHDISVPVETMPQFIETAIPLVEAQFPDCRALAFGHLGDGNVHFHVLAPPGSSPGVWEEEQGRAISQFVHDLVTQWSGSISAEHGIGQMKRDELQRLGDPVKLSLMRAVKNALDPLALLNPGKLLPR